MVDKKIQKEYFNSMGVIYSIFMASQRLRHQPDNINTFMQTAKLLH